jgi:hypothetical protein
MLSHSSFLNVFKETFVTPYNHYVDRLDTSWFWSTNLQDGLTHNHVLAKFMTQVIRLKMNYPEYRIKSIHMDNAAKFSSRAFNDYSMAHGIEVQHFFSYVHTQNGLAESLIKRIKLIARPLL